MNINKFLDHLDNMPEEVSKIITKTEQIREEFENKIPFNQLASNMFDVDFELIIEERNKFINTVINFYLSKLSSQRQEMVEEISREVKRTLETINKEGTFCIRQPVINTVLSKITSKK